MGYSHGVAGLCWLVSQVQDSIALGIDYAMVAAPTAFHEDLALALAEAGVHALIDNLSLLITNLLSALLMPLLQKDSLEPLDISSVTTQRYNNYAPNSMPVTRKRLSNRNPSPRPIPVPNCRCWRHQRFSNTRYRSMLGLHVRLWSCFSKNSSKSGR
jgi:hypothetical protein